MSKYAANLHRPLSLTYPYMKPLLQHQKKIIQNLHIPDGGLFELPEVLCCDIEFADSLTKDCTRTADSLTKTKNMHGSFMSTYTHVVLSAEKKPFREVQVVKISEDDGFCKFGYNGCKLRNGNRWCNVSALRLNALLPSRILSIRCRLHAKETRLIIGFHLAP